MFSSLGAFYRRAPVRSTCSRNCAVHTQRPVLHVPALLAAAAILVASVPLGGWQDVSNASRVKAAILYRFPGFVEWPAEAVEGRTTLDICVLGPTTPFGTVLDELVAGEALGGRALNVRLVTPRNADTCHVLFVPDGSDAKRTVLASVADRPVLTISDADRFLDEGGIVQLRLLDDRVRFEVDLSAAERAGIRLSAQLLRLALRVRGGTS
jgi:hypothetical protein